jgi:UDP-N-acetyl-D-mannosaminuronic acid transferase (WecB/TagA/CpsF family)
MATLAQRFIQTVQNLGGIVTPETTELLSVSKDEEIKEALKSWEVFNPDGTPFREILEKIVFA